MRTTAVNALAWLVDDQVAGVKFVDPSQGKIFTPHSPKLHCRGFFALFVSQASIISSLNRHWLPTLNAGSRF